jgi:pSer/pThr/pTyr-binding forkhead associated (FHA) protein
MTSVYILELLKEGLDCLDIEVPSQIPLNVGTIVLGRGSPKFPVDVPIVARKNGKDIISRRHAEVSVLSNGDCILKDLGAVNGIFVNSVKILSQVLREGDRIQFGGVSNIDFGCKIDSNDDSLQYIFRTSCVDSPFTLATTRDLKRKSHEEGDSGRKRIKCSESLHNTVTPSTKTLALTDKVMQGSIHNTGPRNTSAGKQSSNNTNSFSNCKVSEYENSLANEKHLREKAELRNIILQNEFCSRKEIGKLKDEIKSQASRIKARDSTICTLNDAKVELIAKVDLLKKGMKEVAEKLSIAETELSQLKNNRNDSNMAESRDAVGFQQRSLSAPTNNPSQNIQCSIRNSALNSSLLCLLCSELLCEAVILPCTHGFCRACLEEQWAIGAKEVPEFTAVLKTKKGGAVCRCPRCNMNVSGYKSRNIEGLSGLGEFFSLWYCILKI